MYKIFQLILLRNWRSITVLFSVLLLSNIGFLMMRQLTANIEKQVIEQTQPLFGADIRISGSEDTSVELIDRLRPYLSGVTYSWAERVEFSTTLFDREGKTGLINVIAYTGNYPQKGILKKTSLSGTFADSLPVSVTPEILSRYSSGGQIRIDDRLITPTHTIIESSDLGFSFGGENSLIILPRTLLSGSMLISSGSRLDRELLISLGSGESLSSIVAGLREIPLFKDLRIRSVSERSERNFDTTKELTNYILLILFIATLFSLIILRSAHAALFAQLGKTLSIIEILGFSRRRQRIIFGILYSAIIPLSFGIAVGVSVILFSLFIRVPEAQEFVFLTEPIWFTLKMMTILVLTAFSPIWIERFTSFESWYRTYLRRLESRGIVFSLPSLVLFIGGCLILVLIFEDILWSMGVMTGATLVLLFLGFLLLGIYKGIFTKFHLLRRNHFFLYDGFRTLVRPMTPTVSLTLSLTLITSFFIVFGLFSLSFRDKLILDSGKTANIYAINILPTDYVGVTQSMSGIEIYSILRARVTAVNGLMLAAHLGTPEPSREFTREFNITTTPLSNPILVGKKDIEKDEVSMDDDFAKRLGVTIGDRITFLLSGREVTLTVSSIRASIRDGFRPFFYFSFSDTAFANAPKTYFAASYTTDPEGWKRQILEVSGPHVTFIDVENILKIAREVSTKILGVISLFFGAISIFGILAIYTLFGELRVVERLKKRLYPLFGAATSHIRTSLHMTRIGILGISFFLSQAIGIGIYLLVIRSSAFLSLNIVHILILIALTLLGYLGIYSLIRPR